MNFFDAFKKALAGGGPVVDKSPTMTVDQRDWAKIAIHGLIVGGAATVTVLAQYLTATNWGEWNALVIPAISTLSVYVQKLLKENDPIPTDTK